MVGLDCRPRAAPRAVCSWKRGEVTVREDGRYWLGFLPLSTGRPVGLRHYGRGSYFTCKTGLLWNSRGMPWGLGAGGNLPGHGQGAAGLDPRGGRAGGTDGREELGWSQHSGGGADITGAQPEVQVRTDRWGVLLAGRIPSLLRCPGLSSPLGSRWQSRTAPPSGQPAPFPMRIPSFIVHILTRFSIGGETQSHFSTTGGVSGPG